MTDLLYGNEALQQKLSLDLAHGTLSHAYILEGAAGSGKHLLAWGVASALSGISAERLRSGACPDVSEYRLPSDRKTISVEQIRKLKESVALKPVELSVKIYLISDADAMTVQAQNAFLKLLEEPPQNVYFFLLCESASSLLATVRSRAPILRLQRFSQAELAEFLLRDSKIAAYKQRDPEGFRLALSRAGGTVGGALLHLTGGKDRKELAYRKMISELLHALCRRDTTAVVRAVSAFPQKREELPELTELLLLGLRDLLAEKKNSTAERLFFSAEEAAELAADCSAATLVAMTDAVLACKSAIAANGNLTLTLTLLTQKLLHTVHR